MLRQYWNCPHLPVGCIWHHDEEFIGPPKCYADGEGWHFLNCWRELMKPTMSRPKAEPPKKGGTDKWVDASFEKDYPFLAAFLSCTEWDDKTTRTTGTMLIFTQDGQLKCCLNDRDVGRSAFVTAPTLNGLYDAVELGLETDALDWRTKK